MNRLVPLMLVFGLSLALAPFCLAAGSNPEQAEDPVSDLAKLLAAWADICGDRWEIAIDDPPRVCLYSKGTVLGSAPGYNFGPGEHDYRLQFRFKVVNGLDRKIASQRRDNLQRLRNEGNQIDHHEAMGYFWYQPKGEKEWDLVLQIRRAEAQVAEIPNLKYRSVYLAEEYSMSFFQPNRANERAMQYKRDIERFNALLEKLDRIRPYGN